MSDLESEVPTSTACLAIVAKCPIAGEVKTRLGRTIGDEPAARLAEAFLRDSLANAQGMKGVDRSLFYTPTSAARFFRSLDSEALVLAQPEGDLGARLHWLFDKLFGLGYERVIAVGADTPHLSTEAMTQAFERLQDAEALVAPSEDGGYYGIGLRSSIRRATRATLFRGISWGSPQVLAETLERAERSGIELASLAPGYDIDEHADLVRLVRAIRDSCRQLCPHTARTLTELGIDLRALEE